MSKLISVIMPVYNKEKYLLKSISSVLKQTYTNFELILINDGSTDRSEDIIIELKQRDSRIHLINIENGGVSNARNVGIKNAKGEYVTFLDADDYFEADFLENMISSVKDYNVCYCGHNFVSLTGGKRKTKIKFKENDILIDYLLNLTTPHTNSWLIKKEFLVSNNIYFEKNLNWGEDMLFFSKVLTLEKNVKACKRYLTNYLEDVPGSLSVDDLDKLEKDIEWLKKYRDFLRDVESKINNINQILDAIYGYRLPALIIYRLYSNRRNLSKDYLILYQKYIDNLKFNNGLRSLKLFIYKGKLLRSLNKL